MKSLLKEPLLHFALVGAAIFALSAFRDAEPGTEAAADRIAVTQIVIDRLSAGYERQFGRAPDEDELRGLVAAHIREEVLYREALALGLDRDDTIVRRRMAQKMEFLTADVTGALERDEAALKTYFEKHAERYARPARLTFRHVYFSAAQRGPSLEKEAREALAALAAGGDAEMMGDAFLNGFEFAEHGPSEIDVLFGGEFAAKLGAQRAGEWHGPVASSYGLHLVRVERRTAPQAVTLEEAREAVVRDFDDEQRRAANDALFDQLRKRYEVTVDEAALKKAAAQRTVQR